MFKLQVDHAKTGRQSSQTYLTKCKNEHSRYDSTTVPITGKARRATEYSKEVTAYCRQKEQNLGNPAEYFFFVQCHHMSLWTLWSSLLGIAGV